MPYNLHWHTDHMLYLKVWSVHSEQEVRDSARDVVEWVETTDPPVVLVIDIGDMVEMPMNIRTMQQGVKAVLDDSKIGYLVFIGISNNMVRFIADVLSKISGRSTSFINRPDELDPLTEKFNLLHSASNDP